MPDPATPSVVQQITARLDDMLQPSRLEVVNDSHHHRGHMGDDGTGETHFTVAIESPRFAGLNRVARQRLVNQALADLLEAGGEARQVDVAAQGDRSR